MNTLFDPPAVLDRDQAKRLSDAARAGVARANEIVGQKRPPLSDGEAKKLLPLYESGLKDLQSGADEVLLYRPDLDRKFAFTRMTLGGLEQGLRKLRIQLGIERAAAPPRRFA